MTWLLVWYDAARGISSQKKHELELRDSIMKDILIAISGEALDFQTARVVAGALAERGNEEATLIAWSDEKAKRHSPCCVKCEIGDRPGWEVYGENHGGRLKISINDGEYVFIYS